MKAGLILFVLALLTVEPLFAGATEQTLCNTGEKPLFSCRAKKKIISVCSSDNLSRENGVVIYRYGSPDRKPELEYSSQPGKFDEYFQYASWGYAKGGTQELSFNIGKYTYTVHQDSHVYRPDSAGVFVERKSKILSYIKCDNPSLRTDLYPLHKIATKTHKVRNIGTLGP